VPILRNAVPKYRLHRATKQAVVTLSGRDHYLGPWKSKASLVEYDRLIAEWLAAGRTVPKSDEPLTVAQLLAAYRQYAEKHYRRSDGTPTKTLQSSIAPIARRLREWYGSTAAADFGPLALSAFMERMIAEGCSRNYVNSAAKRIAKSIVGRVQGSGCRPSAPSVWRAFPGCKLAAPRHARPSL
jgi:hypothetical protein